MLLVIYTEKINMGKKANKIPMTREFMEFLRRKSHGADGAIFDDIIKQLNLPALPPRRTRLSQAIERLI